jgi:hypothetical protein
MRIRIVQGMAMIVWPATPRYMVWMPPEAWHGRRPEWFKFRNIERMRRGI